MCLKVTWLYFGSTCSSNSVRVISRCAKRRRTQNWIKISFFILVAVADRRASFHFPGEPGLDKCNPPWSCQTEPSTMNNFFEFMKPSYVECGPYICDSVVPALCKFTFLISWQVLPSLIWSSINKSVFFLSTQNKKLRVSVIKPTFVLHSSTGSNEDNVYNKNAFIPSKKKSKIQ